MKVNKIILLIFLGIFIFLICDRIRVFSNSDKEIISIYKNFTSMPKDLKQNMDFSIDNGDFNIKDKVANNSILKGNVVEIKKYFEALKNNMEILTKEMVASISNENDINNQENSIDNNEENTLSANNVDTVKGTDENTEEIDNSKNIIENYNENVTSENEIFTTSSKSISFPVFILVMFFFIIVISYIKFE